MESHTNFQYTPSASPIRDGGNGENQEEGEDIDVMGKIGEERKKR